MIYVVATIEVVAGKLEEFLAVQRPLLALVRAEAGCIEYVPTVEVALEDREVAPAGQHRRHAGKMGNTRTPQGPLGGAAHGRIPRQVEGAR